MDAARLLPEVMMIVVGPTRGNGFHGVTFCALLSGGGSGPDCTCTYLTIPATFLAVGMVPASVVRGISEFCYSCSDSRMNCSTVDSGFVVLTSPLLPGVFWQTPCGASLIGLRASAVVVPFSATVVLPGGLGGSLPWWSLVTLVELCHKPLGWHYHRLHGF